MHKAGIGRKERGGNWDGLISATSGFSIILYKGKGKAIPLQTGLDRPRGFQEVKVPRLHYNIYIYIYIKVKVNHYYYLAGCATFLHLPAPI